MKINDLVTGEFFIRLAIAAALGVAIGFERQWRQRSAGLHTSSLVAIGASLFALLDQLIEPGNSARIVAGVVTGVGFIAGGVIFHGGATVVGLNTAATIWATAAIGALAGFGLWIEATAGAFAIILFNVVLQPLATFIDVRMGHHQEIETSYTLSLSCMEDRQAAATAAIRDAVEKSELMLRSLTRHRIDPQSYEIRVELVSPKVDDEAVETLSMRLMSLGGVTRSSWVSSTM